MDEKIEAGQQNARLAMTLALNTTMRASEIKGLQWRDVNFLERTLTVRESKTDAGRRVIPLNGEAWDTVLELHDRAKTIEAHAPQFFVFPACENNRIDPARPQRSWRSAWRALRKKAGLQKLRFHDLRHHAITELAESQASDQTIMAIAGHVSREMLEHYSHVRLEAKRSAVEALSQRHLAHGYVTRHDTTVGQRRGREFLTETKEWSGREDLNLRPPGPEILGIGQVYSY